MLVQLHRAGQHPRDLHGDVWCAGERLRPGLGKSLWELYKWRRRADYATGPITLGQARALIGQYTTLCASIGVHPEE
ncbi:MAG: hypothetical protein FJ265_07985 [Planctomycetes bacterium]|nr:hypothetical protein [Planctomycetota bacterium]